MLGMAATPCVSTRKSSTVSSANACRPRNFVLISAATRDVVQTVYIRRVEKQNGKFINKTIKTYHNVSQFWTYDEKKFLAQPVYSRDYPPLKQ